MCEEKIFNLTQGQQKLFDTLFSAFEKREMCLLSSEDRNIGKTTILRELGLELQSLGYRVHILTPYRHHEYIGNKFISLSDDVLGICPKTSVILADEARYCMMGDLVKYCNDRKIPLLGFVNYEVPKIKDEVKFEKEYECNWF